MTGGRVKSLEDLALRTAHAPIQPKFFSTEDFKWPA
jgi:hypothetical protein